MSKLPPRFSLGIFGSSFGVKGILNLFLIFMLSTPAFALPGVVSRFGPDTEIRFAAVGDYGTSGAEPEKVARLIKSWFPHFIITLGDNNYPTGESKSIDDNIGRLYHDYIGHYKGRFGKKTRLTRFFPSLGNHDWDCENCKVLPVPYLDYFSLAKNERYYEFIEGPVHFFSLDSDPREPDGITQTSTQAIWLKNQLARSTSPFNIVFFHHPPYSSGPHGDSDTMKWPFKEWGASAVLAGHEHIYERFDIDGMPYFVNGLGGQEKTAVGSCRPQCKSQYDRTYGAMKITANKRAMTFEFYSTAGVKIDQHVLRANE